MLLRAYSIFDNKAVQYHPPFYQSTDAAAIRSVRDLVDNPETSVGRHPADYTLFLVGEWDDQSGTFRPWPVVHVCDAIALVANAPVPLFKKEA